MKIIIVALLCVLTCSVNAQKEDFCSKSENKKIKKIYVELYDGKTTDKERFALLKEAMEIDEYCIQCLYDYALLVHYDAYRNFKSYDRSIKYFKRAMELCPTYHADMYYYMALMYYEQEDREEAISYMQQFLDFKAKDENSISENHSKKISYITNLKERTEFWHKWHTSPVPFEPEKVENVNTKDDEYLPMLSPDNELLYFTRKIEKMGTVVETFEEPLYISVRPDELTPFGDGQQLSMPFNDDRFVGLGGVTISVNNKEMILCGCEMVQVDINGDGRKDPSEVYKNCDLFSTKFEKEYDKDGKNYVLKWSKLERLYEGINTPDGWEATPSLSGDGQTLFFSAIRQGMTDIDIFYCKRQDDGSWGGARRLRVANSNGDDKSPFMHSDSKTLYFVSGPNPGKESEARAGRSNYRYERDGAGGFDLYYSKQKSDGSWEEPVLMAKPINTEYDEVGLIVTTDGHWAYFATNRVSGSDGMDIYRFKLYEEARPDKVVLIKGEIKNAKDKPETDAVVEIKKKESGEKVTAQVGDDGKYAIVVNVEEKDDLILTTKKKGHFPKTELVSQDEIDKMYSSETAVVRVEQLKTEPVKVGGLFEIPDILYATNSAELNANSKFVLDQFVEYLKENPGTRIEIQGHTDNVGNPSKNKLLSQKRAEGVKQYMISKGISASRLTSVGYGEERPKVKNDSEKHRAMNRRTVFRILSV